MSPWVQVVVTVAFSALVQLVIGVAIVAAMKQQVADLVGWVKGLAMDVKDLQKGRTDHEGRIAHVEGRLGIPRES